VEEAVEDRNYGDSRRDSPVAIANRDYRTWTDDTGTFAVIAKCVGFDGDNIRLQRKHDGREISVPLARLSKHDRDRAERLKKSPQPKNPFEP